MGKFKFSYKRFAVTVMVGAIIAATTATAAFSYAWFTNHNNVTNNDLKGSTEGAYFARGDGTQVDPYVINQPIHLYNLAWLQYIGAFKDKEPYFLIESNLDMGGWTLPPIGTTDHPFTGHLDGYDKTHSQNQTSTAKISNLTISNDFAAYGSKHPAAVTKDNFQTLNITGLFGVIEQPTKDTTTPSLQNLYVDKLTVSSTTRQTLTGLVAGYVNGKIDGVGINDSKLDLASGTTTASYKSTTFQNISKYTSVGYCTENYETSYVKTNTTMYTPAQVGTASFNPTGAGGGTENDWGGSIDMFSLTKRITYIVNDSLTKEGVQIFSGPNGFNLGKVRIGKVPSTNPIYQTKDVRVGLQSETYLPLNVDLEKEFKGSETITKYTIGGKTTAVAATTDFFKNNTVEPVVSNTGYLTATATNSNDQIQFNVMEVSGTNGIDNSLGGSVYDPEKLALLYCASDGSLSKIRDGKNLNNNDKIDATGVTKEIDSSELLKYSSVKQNIGSMINKSFFYNLKWMLSNSPDLDNPSTISAEKISISKNSYKEFSLLAPGIDFFVDSQGCITCLLTPYPNGGNGNILFSLYKVSRNKDGSNPKLEKITNGIPDSVNFDRTKAILYMEIPVEAGEYFITNPEKGNTSASLMYLDIGANAGGTSGNKVDRTKIYEVFEQVNEEFKYPNGVEIVNFADAAIDTKKFAVVVGASYTGEVKLNYAGANNASITVTESSDTGLGYYEAGLNFTSGSTAQVGATITHTRTQRLTYFDHYREDASDTKTPYTNVLQFSQTQTMKSGTWSAWSDTTRSDYRSDKGNADDFSKLPKTETLTIYDDEGKATTIPTIATPSSEEAFWKSKIFTLQTTDPTVQSINADWIQTGSYPTPYVFKVSGYKFTMKDSTETDLTPDQYSISINDANYAVSINPKP